MGQKRIYDDEKGMHDGHRKRLIDMVDRVGVENVTNIQALEYILFFIFPRGDVNPLAHRLLDRFHDIPSVMEASSEDLQAVRGMGESSAKKLHSLLEIFYFYSFEKFQDNQTLKTTTDFYDYLEQLLRYRAEEELFLFGVTPSGEVTKGRRFGKGKNKMVGIDLREIALYISTHKVERVILVHNHPEGSCISSTQDEESYRELKGKFAFSGCSLDDMVIVGKDGIYSMELRAVRRIFGQVIECPKEVFLADLQQTRLEKQQ